MGWRSRGARALAAMKRSKGVWERYGLRPAVAATLFGLITLAGGGTRTEALAMAAVSAVVGLCLP